MIQRIYSADDDVDDDDDDDVWILSCAITEAEMKWDTITSQISAENRHRTQHVVVDYVCSHAQDTYAITAVGLYSRCAAANNRLKIEFADGVITLQHPAVEVYHVVGVWNSVGRDIATDRKNDTKPGNFP